ncbi:hypothetical protein H6F75_26940 [Nodosilinea sp. FACHB-131]|uniref:hypothetical protein n=1 Tax=Cyanophyceae TaxID=3028117 RepID=UPI001687E152|nr:hypothetical protein [Nodosilinea sp. FACHB-131]MBD1877125.1 hypothetical protein [Nodosilinea sp. FACHB-131]
MKYFLLSLAGCTIAYVAAVVLEISFVSIVSLEQILARASILVVCLIAIAVIAKSLRY